MIGGVMARPKNTELKDDIVRAAARQFEERGYGATSYTTIAQECGISRNLAQYHWPKKELLAVRYMEDVLARCVDDLGFRPDDLFDNYARIAAVGTRFFETLLEKEGTRQFLKDVIVDRDLTETVLAFNLEWVTARVDAADCNRDVVQRTVISRMGGFYDLLYWCLKHEQPMDIEAELGRVVDAFRDAVGG